MKIDFSRLSRSRQWKLIFLCPVPVPVPVPVAKRTSGNPPLIAGHKYEHVCAKVGEAKIWVSCSEKLLGINIDRELSFNYHVSNLCIAGRKISALARISRLMSFDQRRLLMKSFIESQFAYSPLVWMFHDRHMNNKINKLHERSLRIVYKDDISSFEELLLKDGSLSTHHRNIHGLTIEMYKSVNDIAPAITKEIFMKKGNNGLDLRSKNTFLLPKANTVHYGHDSLKYLGCKIWNIIPNAGADPGSVSVGVRLTYFRRPKMVFSTSVVLNGR